MIYLIRSAAMVSESSKDSKQEKEYKFKTILKIGWTVDGRAKDRFNTYKSHNPTIQVLKVFPEFGLEVEKVLHSKFSQLRFPGTSEWYLDCAEIINFFFSPDCVQELRKMDEESKVSEKTWEKKRTLLCYLLRTLTLKIHPVLEYTSDEEDWWRVIKEAKYPKEIISGVKKKEITSRNLPKELSNILNDLLRYKTLEKKSELLSSLPIEDLEHFTDLGLVEMEVERYMLGDNEKS